ncbi:methyltransferase, putative [Hepatocystis sp. ex Piliocolobus tephrosceles]|nr:methyltransferase, putative [Hepatocystis sp. ex Piliocolobus tephrosceles]
MFTLDSFKKLLLGVTVANGGVLLGSFYIYKANRPYNDTTVDKPSEIFRIKTFDDLAKNYDEQTDFLERITSINKYKKRAFKRVKGVVLEIGAGTGRNFPYLKNIEALVCIEKSENMCKQLKKKIEQTNPPYPVYVINNDIKNCFFKPNVFDSVISSFTLCSLEYVDESLKNVYNSMKQDAKFFLIERGIIYNKIFRYILQKLNLYPNKKIPWEYGYYEDRSPLQILKKNNFNIIFKHIKNSGSIYILTAKKNINHSVGNTKQILYEQNQINSIGKYDKIQHDNVNKAELKQANKKEAQIDINDILLNEKNVFIYYSHKV